METAFIKHLVGNWSPAYLLIWFFASYLYHGLGITLGYHRLLTHKSLTMPNWLMYLIVSGGYLCLMGSPVVWVAVHRLHHQKSDIEGDPHSPVVGGFKHALYGWMFSMSDVQSDDELRAQCRDLMKDPVFRWLGSSHAPLQAMRCLLASVAFRTLILLFFGLSAMVANTAAMLIVFWSTQLVNAVCHLKTAGYRSFKTRDESRNVWWVGVLALGEGWHNNHHAIPTSARHGMDWWEFDITWYSIVLLEKLGLCSKIVRPPLQVLRAKIPVEAEEPVPAELASSRR